MLAICIYLLIYIIGTAIKKCFIANRKTRFTFQLFHCENCEKKENWHFSVDLSTVQLILKNVFSKVQQNYSKQYVFQQKLGEVYSFCYILELKTLQAVHLIIKLWLTK